MTKAPRLCVLHERVVDAGREVVGRLDDGLHRVGDDDREDPAKEPPGRLEALDHRLDALGEGGPDELVPAPAGGDDEGVAEALAAGAVGHKSQSSEVNLTLGARRRVVDPHGGACPAPCSAALEAEARQRAIGDVHALATQQHADLDGGQPARHPGLDVVLVIEQRLPALPVAVGPARAHDFAHLADQLVGQLLLPAAALHAERLSGCDVAPSGAPADARRPRGGPLPFTVQPAPQRLFTWTTVTSLNAIGPPPPLGVGCPAEPASGRRWWSLRVVLRLANEVVPCHWRNHRPTGPM